MRPISVSVTGVGTSSVIVPDHQTSPFNVGLGCKVTGTATYSVEHTFDDVFSPTFTPASATWIANSGLTAKTATADGNYAFPVTGIRLNVTAGTGTVTLTVVQGLPI
jgi:hypothetical protein